MERDYDDAANIGVYIAGAIADAKTIADLRTQLADATARAEKANDNEHVLRAERDDAENESGALRTQLTAAVARAEKAEAERDSYKKARAAAAAKAEDVAEALKRADDYAMRVEQHDLVVHPQCRALLILAAEVRRLSGAVPAGCVRDETGADVPFVGTLPRTADGVIVGHGATIHHPVRFRCNDKNHTLVEGPSFTMVLAEDADADRDATRPPFVAWGGPQHDCAGIDECYSTRDAAEVAHEKGTT